MAQGAIKKSNKPTSFSKRSNVSGPKKGARRIAPKRTSLVKQRGITKKISAGLIGKTERNLAEKAGHLEMLKGGKKKGGGAEKAGKGKEAK